MLKPIRELDERSVNYKLSGDAAVLVHKIEETKRVSSNLVAQIESAQTRAWNNYQSWPCPGLRERFGADGAANVELDLLQALLFAELYHTGLLFSAEKDSDFVVVYVWGPTNAQ